MSLSTRAIAGIGALVVIGAGTVGGWSAYAAGQGQPEKDQATLVVGSSSVQAEPLCYNDGKALDQDAIAKCQTALKNARTSHSLATSDVRAGDKIGVGMPTEVADKGWYAYTDGGQQGQASITPGLQGATYSGSISAASVLTQTGTTMVTVISSSAKTNEIYGVWAFQLNQQD